MSNSQRRLVFFCPSSLSPSGGIKQIYRHVKILQELGLNVILVLDTDSDLNRSWLKNDFDFKPYFRPNFFLEIYKNKNLKKKFLRLLLIKIRMIINSFLNKKSTFWHPENNDILIIPEIWVRDFENVFPNNDIIIFNQNCFYTVNNFANLKNLKGVVTVSNYSYNYLKLIYNREILMRITLGINTEVFSFEGKKKKIISYMSRKRPKDVEQLLFLSAIYQDFENWEFVNINNVPEIEVAEILKKSIIFLSTSDVEGFGLPPAEAMSCGCIVIGYDGVGGQEFFNSNLCFKINSADILEYFNCLKEVVVNLNINFSHYENLRKSASDFIKYEYSLEVEKNSVHKTWLNLLNNFY
jgi:glycosyltransferase involved in cell wall biosynthesis